MVVATRLADFWLISVWMRYFEHSKFVLEELHVD